MRRRYRRRTTASYGTSGHSMFGGTGWLFADLLLALALAFLLATTVGSKIPNPTPKPTPTAHPTPRPSSTKLKKLQPVLQLDPVHITFTIADPTGLADESPAAIKAVANTILRETSGIKKRSAGIVLLFGGNGSGTEYLIDKGVESAMKSISGPGSLFHQETRYVPFLNIGDPGEFSMDVYLFATS